MLLQRLSEYADRLGLPPPMYQNVPIRYVIELDSASERANIIDQKSDEHQRGKPQVVPSLKRASAVRPKLLADNGEYVLGIAREASNPNRVRVQHAAFVALINTCAEITGEPTVKAVARFLSSPEHHGLRVPGDFNPSATITFEIDGICPVDLPSVQAWWAQYASVGDDEAALQCLVCGQVRPAVERLAIRIRGIPNGQQAGTDLISANAPAFESYGLRASLTSPTCEDCGQRFGNALNHLLADEQTRLRIGSVVYIFWTRHPVSFPLVSLFALARHDDVSQFLTAPWRSTPAAVDLDHSVFYAVSLSASGARVVVRDWIEMTLGEAQSHMARYFRLQHLRDDKTGNLRWFPLYALARATTNSKSREEDPPAQVVQTLLHVALKGGALPDWLLYQAIRRTRSEQQVTAAHAALIKMVLLSQREPQIGDEEGKTEGKAMTDAADMIPLTPQEQRAYACGRLLAVLETIQYEALGRGIGATIIDRYFGSASSAPASVFPRLVRGAQPHLSKLRREREHVFYALDRRLQDILAEVQPTFPRILTLHDQGLFALGYYHQKAEQRHAINEARAAKAAANGGIPGAVESA